MQSQQPAKGADESMLKNLGYDGLYRDQDISVSALLENPLDFGLDAGMLVFSITIRDKRAGPKNLTIEDFSFYIMDEQGHTYSAQKIPYIQPITGAGVEDDEPIRDPDGLILTEFRHEFLFQDLRIAFRYGPNQQLHIFELKY